MLSNHCALASCCLFQFQDQRANSTNQLHQTRPSHKLIRCAYQFPVNIHIKKEHRAFLPLHIALEEGGNLVNLKCCIRLGWCIVVIIKFLSSQCCSVGVEGTVAAPPKRNFFSENII